MPIVLGVADVLIARRLNKEIDNFARDIGPEYFECARKGRQIMDLIIPLAQILEKGADTQGKAAIGQSDMKKCYDHIRPIRVFRWCQRQGIDSALSSAFLRLHSCTNLDINVGDAAFFIQRRCIGVLTGTRIAAVAGRIPILDVAKH